MTKDSRSAIKSKRTARKLFRGANPIEIGNRKDEISADRVHQSVPLQQKELVKRRATNTVRKDSSILVKDGG